ncbi:MAG TPA: pyridoxamine 5'-phosphate oxidase family protein [Acidimicrobiales bacterium]|nr:pyridoxamine 5'-phosphate oxidase family protein [Acidimicrobiales bacterium]
MSSLLADPELAEQVTRLGPTAYLVSVRPDGRPHVVAVTVGWRGAELVAGAGRTTSANVGTRPGVSLVWPAPAGGDGYSLIVDGQARLLAGEDPPVVAVDPGRAVLHRTPAGDPAAPSCVTVFPSS